MRSAPSAGRILCWGPPPTTPSVAKTPARALPCSPRCPRNGLGRFRRGAASCAPAAATSRARHPQEPAPHVIEVVVSAVPLSWSGGGVADAAPWRPRNPEPALQATSPRLTQRQAAFIKPKPPRGDTALHNGKATPLTPVLFV